MKKVYSIILAVLMLMTSTVFLVACSQDVKLVAGTYKSQQVLLGGKPQEAVSVTVTLNGDGSFSFSYSGSVKADEEGKFSVNIKKGKINFKSGTLKGEHACGENKLTLRFTIGGDECRAVLINDANFGSNK